MARELVNHKLNMSLRRDELWSPKSSPLKRKRRRIDQSCQENAPKVNTRQKIRDQTTLTHLMKEVIELKIENDEIRKAADRNCAKMTKISQQNRTYLERIKELEESTEADSERRQSKRLTEAAMLKLKTEFEEYKAAKEEEIEQLRTRHNNQMELCFN